MKSKVCAFIITLTTSLTLTSHAQNEQAAPKAPIEISDDIDLLNFSLEDLMNVPIVSASREKERAFDSPLSSYVLTKKEIINSGATCIPEALRMIPGVTVRQISNGVYDVSIRGLDNLPAYQMLTTSQTTLVMINNRPVFDYLNGGTFWQNLPIEIIDIERIEVVLGPSSPSYGPNAVAGVINIITNSADKDGLNVSANIQGGTPETYIGQAAIGYKFSDKLDVNTSLNFATRGRHEVEYMDIILNRTVSQYDSASAPIFQSLGHEIFPHPNTSLNKIGANASVNYTPQEDVNIHAAGGFNNSSALYAFTAPASSLGLTTMLNSSAYGIVKGDIKGFSVMTSFLSGKQGFLGEMERYFYNYKNFDAYVDYTYKVNDKLNIRPALNYQAANINDNPYTEKTGQQGIFNNNASMFNVAGSLKADYNTEKIRLIGAIRADKFKYPDDLYISYQAIANYKINPNNVLRFVNARSNAGSFIYQTYADLQNNVIPAQPPFVPFPIHVNMKGRLNRNLVTNNLLELGYRTQISNNLQIDFAAFHQFSHGFVAAVRQEPTFNPLLGVIEINFVMSDLDLRVLQNGATLSLNYLSNDKKLNLRTFATVQETTWKNYSPYYEVPGAVAGNDDFNTQTQSDVKSKATPRVFGGFYANYSATNKLNINLNGSYMSAFEVLTMASTFGNERPYSPIPQNSISDKFILNAKVTYQVIKNMNVFVNARNAFDSRQREYFATDQIGALYLVGLHVDL